DVDAGPRICSDENFCHTTLPPKQTLGSVWSDGNGIAWAGTKSGAILRWNGTQWNVHATGLGQIMSIWGASPTEIWAVGASGIYQGTGTTSETVTFTPNELPGEGPVGLNAVWGSGPSDVWAVGVRLDGVEPAGRVFHFTGATTDAGSAEWMLDPVSFTAKEFVQVWGSADSGVWLVGTRTIDRVTKHWVLRHPVGAKAWEDVELPPHPDTTQGKAFPARVFAAGMSGGHIWLNAMTDKYQFAFYHGTSTDNGVSFDWTLHPYFRDAYDSEYSALAASGTDVWAVGGYGRLRTWDGKQFTQAAITVKKVPVTDSFFGVWTSGGEVWAVGEGIALHRPKN
ncbi:MAG: hypothetical protein K0S65_6290, partial [Labilithrix sp.]|nr:hypothetical protein [Labilithrix sp.]